MPSAVQSFRKICVVGLGYIGLPTAAMFASRRIQVVGVDVNQHAVDTINAGGVHIVEPDLDILVRAVVREGLLRATLQPEEADAFIIAVPTPIKGDNHEPDLSHIESAARSIAPVLKAGSLVVLESTCPVGATEAMCGWLASSRPDLSFPQEFGVESDVRVAHCPERVLPGKVLQELVINDRVIGGITPSCSLAAVNLYKLFVTGECVVASGPRVAEMAKLTENSFRDVNIAFANELSIISEYLQIDVWELIALSNRHPRVNILRPGPGVGGHCIAVDPWFIVSSAQGRARLITTARTVNEAKPEWVLRKINQCIGEYLSRNPDKTTADLSIALFGLAFKPDIDDLRESPAVGIAESLVASHPGELLIVEPHILRLPRSLDSAQLISIDDAQNIGDIAVVLVAHSAFGALSFGQDSVVDAVGLCRKI